MPKNIVLLPLFCLLLASLSACAGSNAKDETAAALAPKQQCATLYTYAPGFLMMDVAAGSDVILTPGAREFPVFCSAKEANAHLSAMVSSSRLPRGDWAVFSLNGGTELAMEKKPGQMTLAKEAILKEWIDPKSMQ